MAGIDMAAVGIVDIAAVGIVDIAAAGIVDRPVFVGRRAFEL
jgi:hypothetical protein